MLRDASDHAARSGRAYSPAHCDAQDRPPLRCIKVDECEGSHHHHLPPHPQRGTALDLRTTEEE